MSLTVTHDTNTSRLRLERMRDVSARVALSRQRIYSLIKAGEFPPPVVIHGRSVAWRSDEVDTWISSRTRRGGPDASAQQNNAPGSEPGASGAHVVA